MAGATRMTGHRNHERSHNSIGSTQAKNSLPIRPTKGSGKGDLPPGKTFSKKKILHLEPTENYTFPGREIATSLFFSSFIFTFGSGIGRCHPSRNARLCREQGKLRTLSQNRHKKRHCRTFQYTRQGNIFSRLAYCQWSTEEIESGAAWKHLTCENNPFLDNDSLKRFHLPFNT